METLENQYYDLTKNICNNLQICAITLISIQSKIEISLKMAPFAIDYHLQSPANSLSGGMQLFLHRVGIGLETFKKTDLFSIVVRN